MALHRYFTEAASRYPDRIAVREPSGLEITYRDLDSLTDRLRDRLASLGIGRGARVGMCLHKSTDSVATILGILKCGAAYVPVDPTAPAARNGFIFHDCSVSAIVTEASLAPAIAEESRRLGSERPFLTLEGVGGGGSLRSMLDSEDAAIGTAPFSGQETEPDDLAYILYTSGSTGRPKGVMLSHLNAQRFIDWCSQAFAPVPEDRFSSHAPFHFDLSILDIYVPLTHGATLVLVPETTGKEPLGLAELIAAERLTVWYSTPSILSLLTQYGKLETHDLSSLRLVLFAGEVYPIVHLRALRQRIPAPTYFNLYGPTETNVCTFYELPPPAEDDRNEPYPIGIACPHYEALIVNAEGREVEKGKEGELLIRGDGVMQGYWNLPEQNQQAFFDLGERGRWYRTGDLVAELPDGNLRFIGRKDRMVKKRGYRVELGEIEACLYRHPNIREAATVAVEDEREGVKVVAHITTRDGNRISIIELKQFCSRNLPLYFIPDLFQFHQELPKTSTDKIDYQRLKAGAAGPGGGNP
jgi:amino acid adenylation domain-containing protein